MSAAPGKNHALPAGSRRELALLQRALAALIMQPLAKGDRTAPRTPAGKPTALLAEKILRPNDRLASVERLELYNRQYWFRLVDSMYEDFPGLLALLGRPRFDRLLVRYLTAHPSRSYTLRDLGEKLPGFLRKNPGLAGTRAAQAVELATLEWAQVVAFDGEWREPISPQHLRGKNPQRLRLGVQPCITLLSLSYALDEYLAALGEHENDHAELSNTLASLTPRAAPRPAPRPARRRTCLAIHRHELRVYRKRLHPCELVMLEAIRDGRTISDAIGRAFSRAAFPGVARPPIPPESRRAEMIGQWFAQWSALHWLTPRRR